MSLQHTAIIDWDGTLVENKWPGHGDWMPGAVEAMNRLHDAGLRLMVFSARLSPYDAGSLSERDPALVQSEIQHVRDKLDSAGLTFVDIWLRPGKPTGFVYVDDHAERYQGCERCWDKTVEKVLIRAAAEKPLFAAVANGG